MAPHGIVLLFPARHNGHMLNRLIVALSFFALSVRAADDFAFRLYAKVSSSGGNLLVAPTALRKVLLALGEGAKGDTKAQVAKVLGEVSPESPTEGNGIELYLANRIWIQQEYSVRKEYVKALQKLGGVEVESGALLDDMAVTAKSMNAWTAERTHKTITQIISEESVEEMLVTSALAFEGQWKGSFEKGKSAEFTPSAGKKMKANFMQKTGDMPYAENDAWQAVELAYANDAYSLWVFLPRDVKALSKLERGFTADSIAALMTAAQPKSVEVTLPRFRARFGQNLASALNGLGVKAAFAKGADFSNITGTKELFVHGVFHRAAFDVTEKGDSPFVAALPTTSETPLVTPFKADHSFLYFVKHNPSQQIVLMGRLVNP